MVNFIRKTFIISLEEGKPLTVEYSKQRMAPS